MKNSMILSKFFYFNTKKKIYDMPVYKGLVAYRYKRITIELCISLHTIALLPYFRMFWRSGYMSISLGFLVFHFAVMVDDDMEVRSIEKGGEE